VTAFIGLKNKTGPKGEQGEKGPKGDRGAKGEQGEQGPSGYNGIGIPGVGVPAGGTTGQVLAKINGTDYNTEWVNQSGGGGSVSDEAYNEATWDGVTTVAPSKNAVRDKIESMAADIANVSDLVTFTQFGGLN
jgi:hypothetical protein